MATVSEICFIPEEIGECSQCHRIRPLGRLNIIGDSDRKVCIDCHFGPPMDYWGNCPKCGSLEVNPEAYCYECKQKEKNT